MVESRAAIPEKIWFDRAPNTLGPDVAPLYAGTAQPGRFSMALFSIAAPEDIAEWIRQRSAASKLSSEQTISAVLKEGMERSASVSEKEADLFKILGHYGARPGIGVAAETLWFHWMMKVPGTSGNEIAAAVDDLVKRGFVVAPEGEESAAIYLTDAGFERMKSLEQINFGAPLAQVSAQVERLA